MNESSHQFSSNGPCAVTDRELARLFVQAGVYGERRAEIEANALGDPDLIAMILREMIEFQQKEQRREQVAAETRERAKRNWAKGKTRPDWRPRRRGKLNPDIYPQGGWDRMIGVVDKQVRAAMSKTVLLACIACFEAADYDGQFEMPAGQLGQHIECNRPNAQKALYTLLDAGVLRVVHEGGTQKPNVYSLAPAKEFDKAHAITTLRQSRLASAQDIANRARRAKSL